MNLTADSAVGTRPALVLGRVEGRWLIGHPAFLAGLALTVLAPLVATFREPSKVAGTGWLLLIGGGIFGFTLTLIAANLSALRSRRDRTEELYASLPVPAGARTAAQVLAVAWAAAAVCALFAAVGLAFQVAGKTVVFDTGRPLSAADLLLWLPSTFAISMSLGVALARWLPTAFAGPAAAFLLFLVLDNLSTHPRPGRWVYLIANSDQLDPVAVVWLALFNLGVAAVLAALALRRHGPSGWSRASLAAGLAVAAGGAAAVLHLAPGA
jgi:hypothetical protein